jgi:hypothetical protein
VGFFASLFGQNNNPAPRPAAPSAPQNSVRAGQGDAGNQPPPAQEAPDAPLAPATPFDQTGADIDVPALLAAARAHLDNKDLPAALQLYEQIAAADIDLAEPLTRISGDLGATGHIDALIEFLSPRYSPEAHGLQPGVNLIQAFLHRRNPVAAQQLLDLLLPLVTTYSMRDRLDGFRCAIEQLRAEIPAEQLGTPAAEAPSVSLINISKPVWTYGLPDGENLLPTKNPRTRNLAILPFALAGDGISPGKIAPADHPLAATVRGLTFALAEACWFVPAYRALGVTGLDPDKNLLLIPRAFRGEQVRQLFPKEKEPVDYAITGAIQAAPGGAVASVEFSIWNIQKNKLLKTLRLDGPDSIARAWPLLLGYIEAAKPGCAPLPYSLPADPVAHAIALDHVLHFFLAEKGVVPLEKLAPHAPRLKALADYASAHAEAAVPRLALVAALHHCQALGLELPPEIAAIAEALSKR